MKNAFRYSLKHSIPILISFIPVGLAYGILMQTSGLNWVWTGACSLFVFAGSLQFLAVSFFAGGVSLGTINMSTSKPGFLVLISRICRLALGVLSGMMR